MTQTLPPNGYIETVMPYVPEEDLSRSAVKMLRHLQALPDERTYVIVLTKDKNRWLFSILDEAGYPVRIAK